LLLLSFSRFNRRHYDLSQIVLRHGVAFQQRQWPSYIDSKAINDCSLSGYSNHGYYFGIRLPQS
jgi:hypothetical protein